jgi:hypothetical protein
LLSLLSYFTDSNLAAMNETIDSRSNSQKYSVVQNEDFEDASFEEAGTQRVVSTLTTHKPNHSAWYLAAKFLMSREVLAVHLTWLLVLVSSVYFLRLSTSDMSCVNSRLPSDEVFGESTFPQFGRDNVILLSMLQYLFELSVGRKIRPS